MRRTRCPRVPGACRRRTLCCCCNWGTSWSRWRAVRTEPAQRALAPCKLAEPLRVVCCVVPLAQVYIHGAHIPGTRYTRTYKQQLVAAIRILLSCTVCPATRPRAPPRPLPAPLCSQCSRKDCDLLRAQFSVLGEGERKSMSFGGIVRMCTCY